MKMRKNDNYSKSGDFKRLWDSNKKDWKYIQLTTFGIPESTYKYTGTILTTDETSSPVDIPKLEPKIGHIYEALVGISDGIQLTIKQPSNITLGDLDDKKTTVTKEVAYQIRSIRGSESPLYDPQFVLWIPEEQVPALQFTRLFAKTGGIIPTVIFKVRIWVYHDVTEPEILDKLKRNIIRCQTIGWTDTIH